VTDDIVTPEARLRERIFALPTNVDGGIVYTDPHVRLSDVVAALDAYEEWLAATSSPEPGLDVERLARALNNTVGTNGWLRATPSSPVEEWLVNAELIAREYARLASEENEGA
jgi:hypothetical protein